MNFAAIDNLQYSPVCSGSRSQNRKLIFFGSLLDDESTCRWTLDLASELEKRTGERQNLCQANRPFDATMPTVLMASLSQPTSGLRRLARRTDAIVVLLPPEDQAYFRCRLFEQDLGRPIIPIVCRDDRASQTMPRWLTAHQPIRVRQGDDPGLGVRALARRLLRQRVGLALSAGSAKGLAHIGVIQVLEEQGIEIDAVAGVSMGAYVGACWCHGHDGKTLEALAATIRTRKDLLTLTDPVFPPRQGFIRGAKAKNRLAKSITNTSFDKLVRPFHVVLTDLETLGSTTISHGDVASAVHASLAIPGICEPVTLDDRLYTDGGASDPLPVDVLEDLGLDRIIAVNTQPSLADLEALSMTQGHPGATRWAGVLKATGSFFNQQLNFFAQGNLLDTVMRGLQAAQVRLAAASAERADVYIHAYPTGTPWYAFDAYATAIETGRTAALEQLPAIQTLMSTSTS